MRDLDSLYKHHYKLDQDKIQAPEHLVKDVYRQMLMYQTTLAQEVNGMEVDDVIGQDVTSMVTQTTTAMSPALIVAACVCLAMIASLTYFIVTYDAPSYHAYNCLGVIDSDCEPDPEEDAYPETQDVYGPQDDEDELPVERDSESEPTPESGELPPADNREERGGHQIIIRPARE